MDGQRELSADWPFVTSARLLRLRGLPSWILGWIRVSSTTHLSQIDTRTKLSHYSVLSFSWLIFSLARVEHPSPALSVSQSLTYSGSFVLRYIARWPLKEQEKVGQTGWHLLFKWTWTSRERWGWGGGKVQREEREEKRRWEARWTRERERERERKRERKREKMQGERTRERKREREKRPSEMKVAHRSVEKWMDMQIRGWFRQRTASESEGNDEWPRVNDLRTYLTAVGVAGRFC